MRSDRVAAATAIAEDIAVAAALAAAFSCTLGDPGQVLHDRCVADLTVHTTPSVAVNLVQVTLQSAVLVLPPTNPIGM